MLLNKNFHPLVTLFQHPSVSVNRNYAFTALEDSTKFDRDEKGLQYSQQFECQNSLISDIREVFSVLANQQLITPRNVPMDSESSLTSDTIKMNFDE